MFKYVIAGGGSSSLALCNSLLRTVSPSQIAVIDPSPLHFYRPSFTHIGGCISDVTPHRPMSSTFDLRVHFFPESVRTVNQDENSITTDSCTIRYENLILAFGMRSRWERIQGLTELLEDPSSPVCSVYKYEYALKTKKIVQDFKGGSALFIKYLPPYQYEPAAQEIMNLAEHKWRRDGLKPNIKMFTPQKSLLFSELTQEKGIDIEYDHLVICINKEAVSFMTSEGEKSEPYDFVHIAPPQAVPAAIAGSKLLDRNQLVDVDLTTFRHKTYPNIWAIGDVISAPIQKNLGTLLRQVPVVVKDMQNKDPVFSGYHTSYFLTGDKKLMVTDAENKKYDSKFYYYIAVKLLPYLYWYIFPVSYWLFN